MKLVKQTLFKRTNSGAIQQWSIFTEGNTYISETGQVDGKITKNDPNFAEGKNIGRANETTAEEQAVLEATARWQNKKDGGYTEDIFKVDEAKNAFFKCMLAHEYLKRKGWDKKTDKFTGKDKVDFPCLMQPKLDGIRMISDERASYSRNGKTLGGSFHIRKVLEPLFEKYPDLILDGEMYNHDYRDDFEDLVSLIKKSEEKLTSVQRDNVINLVQYHVYDCPSIDGLTPDVDFEDRMFRLSEVLREEFPEVQAYIKFVPWIHNVNTHEDVTEHYQNYLNEGYEGGMIRYNIGYVTKRSWNLLKVKPFFDAEFELVDLEEGKGKWAGKAKRAIIRLEDGTLAGAGLRGSEGFLETKLNNKDENIGKTVTVRYQGITKFGKLRFPVVTAWNRESYE